MSALREEFIVTVCTLAKVADMLEKVSAVLPEPDVLAAHVGFYSDLDEQADEPDPEAVALVDMVHQAIIEVRGTVARIKQRDGLV